MFLYHASKRGRLECMNLHAWLVTVCKAHDVQDVKVTIGDQTWEGARYKQTFEYQLGMDAVTRCHKKEGDKYQVEAIYCLGKLPAPKLQGKGRRERVIDYVCFPFEQRDWYVAGYMKDPLALTEAQKHFHPFGIYFTLRPWDIPNERIDQYEIKPYNRFPMTLTYV